MIYKHKPPGIRVSTNSHDTFTNRSKGPTTVTGENV